MFPVKIEIAGVLRNLKNRRYCLTCSPFKEHNTRPLPLELSEQKSCRFCNRPLRNARQNVCAPCSVTRSQRRRKIRAVQYYGGKCIRCGYDKCPAVLTFDHRDPTIKEVAPSYAILKWSWDKTKKELDKCDLLCANCHGERHYGNPDHSITRNIKILNSI